MNASSVLGAFDPEIHFPSSAIERWRRAGLTLAEVANALDGLRRAVKIASGYGWDNSHFYLDDVFGHPAIKFSVNGGSLGMWSAVNGTGIGDFEEWPENSEALVRFAGEGRARCSVCNEWFGEGEWKSYSFAGAVCNQHYDPKVHRPPDTRGD